MKYKTASMPRRRNLLIMDYVMNKGANKEYLFSMLQLTGFLCVIFVSDIVMVDRKHLEEFNTARTLRREHTSKYKFLKEALTQDNWTT